MAAGYNSFGREYGRATRNVVVRNFTIFNSTNSAMSIGSETSGGIRNITYENIWANYTGAAARIKSARGRGGKRKEVKMKASYIDKERSYFKKVGLA